LLIEAWLEDNVRRRVEQLRAITTRFPAYWAAWFALGDALTHHGSFLGHPLEESLAALQQATALYPNFVPAWEHYFWRAVYARDTTRTRVILDRLRTFPLDSANADRPDLETLTYYRYLDYLTRSGDQPLAAQSEIGVRVLSAWTGSVPAERLAANFSNYGFHRAQLDLSQRIVAANPQPAILAAHTWGMALARAGRGDWDSAFAAGRRYARMTALATGPLWAWGLAVTGAWLGHLDPDSALALRDIAAKSEHASSARGDAEVTWLDGILACTRGDAAELRAGRKRLEASKEGARPLLARSLAAFEAALSGRRADAARSLAALEWEMAEQSEERASGAYHPFFSAVNRLAAGHWLLEAGDTAQALRLLLLHESDLPASLHPLQSINIVLATAALPELARVEAARGQSERARQLRARLLSGNGGRDHVRTYRHTCGAIGM
jgi:tetratricopeptide (TPR) repeat protein